MAKYVHEIMNHEPFCLPAQASAKDALGSLVSLGVSGAPIVDEQRRPVGIVSWRDLVEVDREARVRDRMTSPVHTVSDMDTIERAADLLCEHGFHRLVVVDAHGKLVGALSIVDVLRGLRGQPIRHPAGFPHLDEAHGVNWTDDQPFDRRGADVAPDGPGVLVLLRSIAGQTDAVVYTEAVKNVRARLRQFMTSPPAEFPTLRTLLEHPTHLRFRAASVEDERRREQIAVEMQAKSAGYGRGTPRG